MCIGFELTCVDAYADLDLLIDHTESTSLFDIGAVRYSILV